MFVYNRSILAVLAPLALLLAVVLWSNSGDWVAGKDVPVAAADRDDDARPGEAVARTASNDRGRPAR
jgi:hypothetical protein